MNVTIWSGLVLGSIYALVASGFIMAMLPTGVFNFAQGAIVVVGSFTTYQVMAVVHASAVVAVIVATLVGAGVGLVCELVTVRPLLWARGNVDNALVTTVGASTALIGLIGVRWGYQPLQVPFGGSEDFVRFAGVAARPVEVVVVIGAFASAIALELLLRFTRLGQVCLAVAEDREASKLRGVDVSRLSLVAFTAAGAFGAVTGYFVGPITYAIPTLGSAFALGGFVAVALGGEGNFLGGLLGGLAVGTVTAFAVRYLGASYGNVAVLVLLLTTLSIRPKGFGGFGMVRNV